MSTNMSTEAQNEQSVVEWPVKDGVLSYSVREFMGRVRIYLDSRICTPCWDALPPQESWNMFVGIVAEVETDMLVEFVADSLVLEDGAAFEGGVWLDTLEQARRA